MVNADRTSGRLDTGDLQAKLGDDVAAVYFENPAYLGTIGDRRGRRLPGWRARPGPETVVGVDPSSLGVMIAPGDYGADIVTGPVQPLGVHMHCVWLHRRVHRLARRGTLRSRLQRLSRLGCGNPGNPPAWLRAGMFAPELLRDARERQRLDRQLDLSLAIAGAVYMSLLGPEGFRELGTLIVSRARYAAKLSLGGAGCQDCLA